MTTTTVQAEVRRIAPRQGVAGVTTPRVRRLGWQALAYAFLLLLVAIVILPFGWMVTVALKPDSVPVFTLPPEWFPTQHWQWENFRRALIDTTQPFGRYFLNTTFIVAVNIVGTLFSCSLAAYAFARLRFRGSELLFNILIITMLVPWQALIIPQFLLFFKLGWYGTYLPLIVPSFTGSAFYIFLIRQYMRTFPKDLDDAARIDGAGYFRVYWDIILPLSRPVLMVVVVFVFLGSWSDLLGPLIYLNETEQFTLAIGLANFVTRASTDWNLLMAANLITILPVLVVYYFAQGKLIGGIASVGMKG
jgi:ABC-type glycerol-3-phosphate transport system permease component